MRWLTNTLTGPRLATLGEKYRRWQKRQAMLRELDALDDDTLDDIGATRADVARWRRTVAAKRADGKWQTRLPE